MFQKATTYPNIIYIKYVDDLTPKNINSLEAIYASSDSNATMPKLRFRLIDNSPMIIMILKHDSGFIYRVFRSNSMCI